MNTSQALLKLLTPSTRSRSQTLLRVNSSDPPILHKVCRPIGYWGPLFTLYRVVGVEFEVHYTDQPKHSKFPLRAWSLSFQGLEPLKNSPQNIVIKREIFHTELICLCMVMLHWRKLSVTAPFNYFLNPGCTQNCLSRTLLYYLPGKSKIQQILHNFLSCHQISCLLLSWWYGKVDSQTISSPKQPQTQLPRSDASCMSIRNSVRESYHRFMELK